MGFTITLKNAPSGAAYWSPQFGATYYPDSILGVNDVWNCPYSLGGTRTDYFSISVVNSNWSQIYGYTLYDVTIEDGGSYQYNCATNELEGAIVPPEGWILLATYAVDIERSVEPMGWILLASTSIGLESVVTGWIVLATYGPLSILNENGVPPPPPPPPDEGIPWLPIAIGVGAAAGIGGLAYLEYEKKKKAKKPVQTK